MKDYLSYVYTKSIVVFAITEINLWLSTLVLILTVAYWVQKNIKQYRENKK